MNQKELNNLKKLLKLLQDSGVTEFANGPMLVKLDKIPNKAVKDIVDMPRKSQKEIDEEVLFYSSR